MQGVTAVSNRFFLYYGTLLIQWGGNVWSMPSRSLFFRRPVSEFHRLRMYMLRPGMQNMIIESM